MGFLESTAWRLFSSPQNDPFTEKSPKLLNRSYSKPLSLFSLPSKSSSTSSSASSQSSASTFWMSPKPPSRWSPSRCIPASIRNTVSKRQIAVILCLLLIIGIWTVPLPALWQNRVVHITAQQPPSSPYQVLRPIPQTKKKNAPDPVRWLEQNSNNKYAISKNSRLASAKSSLGQTSSKPRAALISLVRNSELLGLMQSMRQLEYQWNRKYQYPWVFFNDEPFSAEFKVRRYSIRVDQN